MVRQFNFIDYFNLSTCISSELVLQKNTYILAFLAEIHLTPLWLLKPTDSCSSCDQMQSSSERDIASPDASE